MPVNNIRAVGDDQQWKTEVEKELQSLKETIAILKIQVNARGV